jgi:hypothetical protein
MKKIMFIFLCLLSTQAFTQSITALQYSIGFGTGDLGSYIGKTSFRGVSFDYRKLIKPNVGVGIELGWNTFYEGQSGQSYTRDNTTYSGNQYRYNNQFPMLFAVDWYSDPEGKLQPFFGLGIGTMYSMRDTDMNLYTLKQDAWHFTLRPELGAMIEVSPDVNLMVTGKYNYGFEAGDLPAQSYFTLNFGFVLQK